MKKKIKILSFAERYKAFLDSSSTLNIIVTVTRKCVLKCKYCFATTCENDFCTTFDAGLLRKLIRDANETRHQEIAFEWTGGEALLAGKDFYASVVKLQKEYLTKSYSNVIQTSGAIYNEKLYAYLVKKGFKLALTIDGPAGLHNRQRPYRNGKASFSTILRSARYLKKIQGHCSALCTVTKETLPYSQKLIDFYRRNGMNTWSLNPYLFDRRRPIKDRRLGLTPRDYSKFMIDLFSDWLEKDDTSVKQGNLAYLTRSLMAMSSHFPCDHSGNCLTNFININADGDAYLCPSFVGFKEHCLGNLFQSSIKDLVSLDNPRNKKYFFERLEAIGKCNSQNCSYLGVCHGGCPYASNLNGKGDSVAGSDALCSGRKRLYGFIEKKLNSYKVETLNDHKKCPDTMVVSGS